MNSLGLKKRTKQQMKPSRPEPTRKTLVRVASGRDVAVRSRFRDVIATPPDEFTWRW